MIPTSRPRVCRLPGTPTLGLALCALVGLLAGCGPTGPLAPEERAQVAEELVPRFERVHGATLQGDALPIDRLRAILERLGPAGAERPIALHVTAEADADALCLPGDHLLISRGLLAWIGDEHEAAAVLAAAESMCADADAIWRDSASTSLPEEEPASLRMLRYIEMRLAANAVLYRLAVADACSGRCAERVPARLEAAGYEAGAFDRLVARLASKWPEALWLERIGAASDRSVEGAPETQPPPAPPAPLDLGIEDWSGFGAQVDGLVALAEVRREIGRGRLLVAYRASNRARQALDQEAEARRIHAELELHNNHPFYARDLIDVLERRRHPLPDADYLRGWMNVQLKEYEEGAALLAPDMEAFPRVAGLYQLAVVRARERDDAAAESLLARARAAGPLNPYIDEIDWLVAAIERRRARTGTR